MLESKKEANKRWNSENREKVRYYNSKSSAKSFVNNYATKEDLLELINIINEKLKSN